MTPYKVEMRIKTRAKVPKTGLMFVGLGGNNGTTFTAMCLANREKLVWESKRGVHHSDFLGSVSQIGTFPLGLNPAGEEVFAPVRHLVSFKTIFLWSFSQKLQYFSCFSFL